MPSIQGHKILIIGGTSGIGYSVAEKAVREGAQVHVASSSPDKVKKAVESLQQIDKGAVVDGHVIDMFQDNVTDELEKLFSKIAPLNHVVYTAGRVDFTNLKLGLENVTKESLLSQLNTRLVAGFEVAKMVRKYVKNDYTSSFIITTGSAYEKPIPGLPGAGVFCAAQYGFTSSVAVELAPIRVNAVAFGAVSTGIFGPTEEVRKQTLAPFVEQSPLKKVGTADEAGESYIYLLKDSNNTGSVINCNAGVALI
uniref:ARAD1C44704p n=1 Tax=Blastobotrys adeninivorans TaxID=409370 RepID=A0A060T4F9_BLAAD